ncbi:MAG: hypothetical protein ABI904_15410 [Chloroflexota bacterium]
MQWQTVVQKLLIEFHTVIFVEVDGMTRNKYKISTAILSLALLLSSCLSSNTGTTINVTATNTERAVASPVATATLISPKATPLPTLLPSVKTQCVNTSGSYEDLDLNGLIAVYKIRHQLVLPPGFFLLDANTKRVVRTDDYAFNALISPDRLHIAYTYYDLADDRYIRIVDSNMGVVADFSKFPAYTNGLLEDYFSWQNKDQIRIVTENLDRIDQYLINPFSQARTELKTDWDGIFHPADPYNDKVANWKFDARATSLGYVYGANILYDPTLTRAVFPKEGGEVSLVDVESGNELAHANFTDWGRLPTWSPDGTTLAIVNREGNTDEFYLVSRDGGEFQRITDFAREFSYISIPEYTWSPNGKQIAFWLSQTDVEKKDGAQSELAILDISSKQVTRLCIQGLSTNVSEPWSGSPELIWSPDGKYLLISQWDDPANPKNYYVLAVDPVSGGVDKISKNTMPIGWMIKDP